MRVVTDPKEGKGNIAHKFSFLGERYNMTVIYNFIGKDQMHSINHTCLDIHGMACTNETLTRTFFTDNLPQQPYIEKDGLNFISPDVKVLATNMAFQFLKSALNEIMEEGIERKCIQLAMQMLLNNPINLLTGNLGMLTLGAAVVQICLSKAFHDKFVSSLSKIMPSNKVKDVADFFCIYISGMINNARGYFNIESHIFNLANIPSVDIAQDMGIKFGKYICDKMGGKIEAHQTVSIPEKNTEEIIEQFIHTITWNTNTSDYLIKKINEVTEEMRNQKFVSHIFIRMFEAYSDSIFLEISDKTLTFNSFYNLLALANTNCNENNFHEYKSDIQSFILDRKLDQKSFSQI